MIRSDLAKAETDLSGLKAREAATLVTVNSYTARARALDASSLQEASLQRDFKAEEDNYLLYLKKSEEARISDALDAHRMVNVTLAEAPFVPALPSHSPLFFGGLAMVAMLAATFGLLWSLEHTDRTFHTPYEIEAYLGIPVLVAVPRQAEPVPALYSGFEDERRGSVTWNISPNRESINSQDGSDKGASL
jgi:hypothetical protein